MQTIEVQFQYDKAEAAAVDRTIRRLQGEELKTGLDKLFVQLGNKAARYVRRTQLHFQTLRERSGQLSQAIEGRSERVGTEPAIRVGVFGGPALKYAGPQEEGTQGKNPESPYKTIRPVAGKALAIPVGHALDSMGVPVCPGGPRGWPRPLHYIPFKKRTGGAFGGLFDDSPAGARTMKYAPHALANARGESLYGSEFRETLVYLLVSKVEIPPHWYLRNGVNEFMPQVINSVAAFLRRTAESGGGNVTTSA